MKTIVLSDNTWIDGKFYLRGEIVIVPLDWQENIKQVLKEGPDDEQPTQ